MKAKVEKIIDHRTVNVKVTRLWKHPLYQKSVKRTKNYLCDYHDLKLEVGDMVEIKTCKPISKRKKFTVLNKIEESKDTK